MRGRDMTQGNIWKQLSLFAVPLFLAHLLQQTYNAFDAFIVGRFVSSSALAAVGSSGPVINMLVSFFMGMSSGSSVLIAQYFGAKNLEELKKTVHTAVLLSIIVGAVLSVVGIIVTPALLRLIQTPEAVMVEAVVYLRIYFAGLMGLTVYNMGAAVLTAIGDSKRPLYFLALSSVIKVALNLLFVLVFNMGVAAVAWSTVAAQLVCAVLVIRLLCRHHSAVRLNLRQLRIHKHILKGILKIGLPGGIQGSIISFSNFVVQSYINALGPSAMAGYAASARVDGFIFIPMQSMAMAVSTFVGQNLGSGQVKRARGGVKAGLVVGLGAVILFSAAALIFASQLLGIFTTDESVISHGLEFMYVFMPFYFILCVNQVFSGALRGAGDVKVPTLLALSCFVVLRQLYLFVVTRFVHTTTSVAIGFPIGWLTASILLIIYYRKRNWSSFERAEDG